MRPGNGAIRTRQPSWRRRRGGFLRRSTYKAVTGPALPTLTVQPGQSFAGLEASSTLHRRPATRTSSRSGTRFGAVATVESAILATGHPSSCSATDPGPWTERGEGGLQVHGGRGRQTPLRLAQGRAAAALAARPSPGRSFAGGGRRTGSSGAQWTGRSPTTACRLRPGYPAENARWQIHDLVGKLGEVERDGLAHRRDDERTDAKGRVARIFRTDRRRSATSTSDVKGSATSNSRWQARCTCAAPAPSRVSTSAVASAP